MTSQGPTCAVCGKPLADGSTVCRTDAQGLAQRLTEAAGHAEDAQGGAGRQTGAGGASRSAYGEAPMPDFRRSAELNRAAHAAGTWERDLVETGHASPRPPWRPMVGPLCPPPRPGHLPDGPGYRCPHRTCEAIRQRTPPSELAQALTWLAGHTEALRRHPAAQEAFRELGDVCSALERLVDSPPTGRRLVGMCDCGQILYAPANRDVVECKGRERSCGARWNVAESQQILMDHLDGELVTAAEAAHLAAFLDTDRSQEAIRKLVNAWHNRRLVLAHGQVWRDPTPAELEADPECVQVAVPTFRFGEIRARLAATPRREQRNREGAAA